jgi:hypothetical protein
MGLEPGRSELVLARRGRLNGVTDQDSAVTGKNECHRRHQASPDEPASEHPASEYRTDREQSDDLL